MAVASRLRKPDFWTYVTVGSFVLLGLFLVYPLIRLILSGFLTVDTSEFTLDHFTRFFSRPYYLKALLNSVVVTACVTVLTVAIALPLAYITSTIKIRYAQAIDLLIVISLLSPPFIGAYSWILLFGRSGVVTKFLSNAFGFTMPSIYGFAGILMVFTLKLFPYVYLYTKGAMRKIDASLGEAAESLGSRGYKKAMTVILPVIKPTVLAGGIIVFMRALADYGTPQLIGEGYIVMPVLIYNEFIGETGGSANFAAAISVILMIIAGVVFLIQNYVANRRQYALNSLNPAARRKLTGPANALVHVGVYLVVFVATLPQITVIYTSFLKTEGVIFTGGFSFDSYRSVLAHMTRPIFNTFAFGVMAIIGIVVIGVLISYISVRRASNATRILDMFIMFPYVIPGAVLGITLLLSYSRPPLALSGTVAIIVISYIVRRLPYTVRSSSAILRQINPNIEEAAISLGSPPMRTFFSVTLAAMLPGVLSGAILSWITVINELSSTLILYTGKTATMPVAIFQEVMRASYGTAAALSSILTVTMVLSITLFFRLSGRDEITL